MRVKLHKATSACLRCCSACSASVQRDCAESRTLHPRSKAAAAFEHCPAGMPLLANIAVGLVNAKWQLLHCLAATLAIRDSAYICSRMQAGPAIGGWLTAVSFSLCVWIVCFRLLVCIAAVPIIRPGAAPAEHCTALCWPGQLHCRNAWGPILPGFQRYSCSWQIVFIRGDLRPLIMAMLVQGCGWFCTVLYCCKALHCLLLVNMLRDSAA